MAGITLTGTDAAAEGVERQFDPAWSLPIVVLDRLDELKFIRCKLVGAPIGSLVLVKGHIQIIDIRMLQEMWPSVLKLLDAQGPSISTATANRQERRRQERTRPSGSLPVSQNALLAEVLKQLLHALELHFLVDEGLIWATLNPTNMTVSADDFVLKHGTTIPGDWYMLGILDSYYGIDSQKLIEIWRTFPMSELANHLANFIEIIKDKLGQPRHTFAMTPITIFRSVDAALGEPDTADVQVNQ